MKNFLIKINKIACPAKRMRSGGFLMVEILVAVSIITASILSAMAVAQKSIYISRQSVHSAQAAFLLEEGAENARMSRDNAWANVASINTTETIGIFTRTVVASGVLRNVTTGAIGSGLNDANTKLITVTVSWREGGTNISRTLSFYLVNIFNN